MSLKKNIFANYLSQFYVMFIGIVMLPLYIQYMGAEAYGLVGFFSMLQVWFGLLDMGLRPTMARETARFHGGATDALSYRRLVRALEYIFLVIALGGGASIFFASGYIAENWLQISKLSTNEVEVAIELMALIIAMRWMGGLYRGAISGAERLVWLSGFNSVIATLRFGGVLPLLVFVGGTPTVFFRFQLGVALIELMGLLFYARHILPKISKNQQLLWDWGPLKSILKFSLSISFTSLVWILVTQADKLVLSKILPLAEYGYFTLAVLVASCVLVISGPISIAIMPRMTRLESEGDHEGLIHLYCKSTQFVAVIAGATSISLAFCAEPLLLAWTGDGVLAKQAAPILVLYALGNGVLAVSAFPYYLQYAKGDLRLHMIGNALFAILLIPAIIWIASQYGGVGAAYVWLVTNLVFFFLWLPFVHHKFESGLNLKWYGRDVLSILLPIIVVGFFLNIALPQTEGRFLQFAKFIAILLFLLMTGLSASSEATSRVRYWLVSKRKNKESTL